LQRHRSAARYRSSSLFSSFAKGTVLVLPRFLFISLT
jgi:hypothetical protein